MEKITRNVYDTYDPPVNYEKGYYEGFDDGFEVAQLVLADKPFLYELCNTIVDLVQEKHATKEEITSMVSLNIERLFQKKKEGFDLDVELFETEKEYKYVCGND